MHVLQTRSHCFVGCFLVVGWDFLFEVFVHWIFNELFGFVVVELGFC